MSHYIGIDIGGTKIAGGIVSHTGTILKRTERPTPVKLGGQQILQDAIALAKELIQSTDKKINAIGIGAGGQIDSENGIVYSATDVLPNWSGIHIAEAFSKELALKTLVDNDVNALAIGETRFGAAASLNTNSTIVFLLLDAGVGGALLSNGLVHHGANWSGGEFGQILLTMDPDARKGSGGSIGTLEAYCSIPGLVQTWKELSGNNSPEMTAQDIFADAQANPNGTGAKAIAKTGEYLGFGLVSLANTLHPHLIIIGGELASLDDALLNPARQVLKRRSSPGSTICSVVPTKLGSDAAIVGAASLVMLNNNVPEAATASARNKEAS